jgi:hypothetical protein
MKTIRLGVFTLVIAIISSCSGGVDKDKVVGKWKLVGFSNNGEKIELTDCDNQTIWNFTMDPAEALNDRTQVQKLYGKAPEECKYYSFDAKWTTKDEKLFVSTSRIGGMGGVSLAGMMEIVELTENKLVLNSMNKEIVLERK